MMTLTSLLQGTVEENIPEQQVTPVVLFRAEIMQEGSSRLLQHLEHFHQVDDVYDGGFSGSVVLTGTTEEVNAGQTTLESQDSLVVYTPTSLDLPAGPYFPHGPNIHRPGDYTQTIWMHSFLAFWRKM